MSDLEKWFKKRLGFLVEPTWPHLADEMVESVRGESELLVRWLIKSAVIFERAVPKGQVDFVPEAVRSMAKGGGITNDFFVALARIGVSDFNAHLIKAVPVWNGGVFHPLQQHVDGFSFAVHLNHLAIRLVRCPEATPGVKRLVSKHQKMPVVPFWVRPALNYDFHVNHSYPNFKLFMEAIELQTGLPA